MNKSTIIRMLEYCGMSYINHQPCVDDEEIIFINDKKTDVQCFVRIFEDTMTIAFRGSDSLKDWKVDSKFWKTEVPYNNYSSKIRVHSGFISTYKSQNVRGKIHKIVSDRIKKIYVTGHSYGAALAKSSRFLNFENSAGVTEFTLASVHCAERRMDMRNSSGVLYIREQEAVG